MAETNAEKLVKYLEVNPEQDWDAIKADVDSRFIPATFEAVSANKELHGKILGKYQGTTLTELNKFAKGVLGLELEEKEFADKSNIEVIRLLGEKYSASKSGLTDELKTLKEELAEAKKSGGSAKDIAKLQAEIEATQTKYNDLKGLHESTIKEFEDHKKNVDTERGTWKVEQKWKETLSSVKLKTKNDFERNGFLADFKQKYVTEIDGEDAVVRDAKTNERIKHPEAHGKFMGLTDLFTLEAKKAGLLDDNPHNGRPVRTNVPVIETQQNQVEGRRKPSLFAAKE
jgi:predicted  nucleic acid-binding Zn-ribbon protein